MTELLIICYEFLKTGMFAIGGGLATLPFLTQMQAKYQWFTAEALANMIAVSESTPGPIGVNMATYVGYTSAGIPGALLATFSLALPSVIVIMLIAGMLKKYRENKYIQNFFLFMRPAVVGLISAAALSVLKIALLPNPEAILSLKNGLAVALFAALFGLMQVKKFKKLHPVVFIAIGAVMGVLLQMG